MSDDLIPLLSSTCERAARAGAALLQQWRGRFEVREKGPSDLVTQADLASQREIRRIVAENFPDHDFVGEEPDESQPAQTSPYRWIVDPLDGTTNYVHGLPFYSVSIAVEWSGQLVVGVVYDPERDECFRAARGRGADCNGKPIQPSATRDVSQALVVTGLAARVATDSPEVARFVHMLGATRAVRRLGSAALNTCYVACGRVDAYWATSVKTWDVAAAALIAREAGAEVSSIDGSPLDVWDPKILVSANAPLHRGVIEQLQRATRR